MSALTTQIKWQEQMRLEVEKEKTRANLLRAVSHDIRTPLTSIQASASGILDNYDALGRQEKVELFRRHPRRIPVADPDGGKPAFDHADQRGPCAASDDLGGR